jgi:parallel beta-helix repeat protein
MGGRPGCTGIQILNNVAHDNGQLGISGGQMNNGLISHNTIYHNNIDNTMSGFGAGGFKTGGSSNLMVSYNLVYNNLGNGMHFDVHSSQVTFDHNTVYNNYSQGLRCEISNNCTFTNNIVYGNGFGNTQDPGSVAAQIATAASSAVTIKNNVVSYPSTSGGGIAIGYNSNRGGCGTYPNGTACTIPLNMAVSGNTVYVAGTKIASWLMDTSPTNTASQWIVPGIFSGNTYCVSSSPWTNTNWVLSSTTTSYVYDTFATWVGSGQDKGESVSMTCAAAP